MVLFKTQRTLVRPFELNDYEEVLEMMRDPDVMRMTGFKEPQEDARVKELLKSWMATKGSDLGVWAVEGLGESKLVGWFMLKKNKCQDPELGYMIQKKFWGQGFATEVASQFLNYAFNDLSLNKVVATVNSKNLSSIRVLEKIGMNKKSSNGPEAIFEILKHQ